MEMRESLLYEAAVEGNTTTLLELLQQDRLILDRVIFLNRLSHKTPLHVAAYRGHQEFVKEILCRKPELAGELDSRQSSPLHIASMKGYVDIVSALLQVNPDMCLARDVDGRNPLHLAAMGGRIDVLEELVRFRPLAASATTLCGETVLHLCVKYQQLEALKLLLHNTKELHHLLNSKDDCGMTILHLAVADKQIEAIQFFITSTRIEANARTANGFTALDILAQSTRDIKYWKIDRLLRDAHKAFSMKDTRLSTTTGLTSHENNQKPAFQGMENSFQKQKDRLEKMRNAVLVVASLIATVAFQAAVNPPGRPPEDKNNAAAPSSELIWPVYPSYYYYYYSYGYGRFTLFNTIAFLASVSTILMLISGLPLNRKVAIWIFMVIMWAAITAMTFTYIEALGYLYDNPYGLYSSASSYVLLTWICVAGVLVLGHIIRGIIKVIKYVKKFVVNKPRGPSISPISSLKKCIHKLQRAVTM